MQPDDKKKCDAPSADQSVQISKPANEPHNKYPQQPTVSLNLPANTCKFCPLTPERFHVLLNSLFKVLFNFPSRYLFAIGLSPVFSLGRSLPPDLGCIPKQPDSLTAPRGATGSGPDGALTLPGVPFQRTWARSVAEDASPDYNSGGEAARFSSWAAPGSLAVTRGILVSFFSSAYLYA